MTRDAIRPLPASSHGYNNVDDLDILSGLWEEALFARLPRDAPSELRDLVEDIENPRRVYAIHKASRRHNFQQLVQKYIVQLREGCGSEHCNISTCFTCRKRAAGQVPLRRYNPTSARIVATHLASQDNPENGLCPGLKTPKGPPAALNSLVFVPTHKSRLEAERALSTSPKPSSPNGRPVSPKSNGGVQSSSVRPRNGSVGSNSKGKDKPTTLPKDRNSPKPAFEVYEEPVSRDHRSFAANVFGTVAFKMLEWLTPAALEDMVQKTKGFREETDGARLQHPEPEQVEVKQQDAERSQGGALDVQPVARPVQTEKDKRDHKEDQLQRDTPPTMRSTTQRRNSNAKVRTSNGPKPKRQMSIDPYPQDSLADDQYSGLLKSPRGNSAPTDKGPRALKPTTSALSRPISQLSSIGYFDEVSLEKMPSLKAVDLKSRAIRGQTDGARSADSGSPNDNGARSGVSSERSVSNGSTGAADPDSELEYEGVLPQTISKLKPEIVDLFCDVMQEDGTAEEHLFEPPTITKFHTKKSAQGKQAKRRRHLARVSSPNLRLEWKLFVEQSLFYVLSDPGLLVKSFTEDGHLYDSQTVWYCMLRMTRVAPSLLFHSLWMAAGSLFAPPKSLLAPRSPTAKLFRNGESLSNHEAGCLLSICLHALVASAPLVTDSRQLHDMSRIRSHGLSLAGSGSVAQQPADLCLQYEDAFTDPFALRLARRLFTALTTRRYFDELNQANNPDEEHESDVLKPLFSQLDFLSMEAVYVLDFTFPDRALHETRVPILLLDWARAVMMTGWDGCPEVAGDGPFGGALALIEAMYKKRHDLLLGDGHFLAEYFAERMDTVNMPLAWLSHNPTRQRVHLLDYPYIFNPSSLVSYFRSINFSRMSHAYEESTVLHDRIDVIASRSTLTSHHKEVLADRLRAAASKYLILDIRRDHVLEDAFDQLWRREERELIRPLKVHLGENDGEEGFDSGGVQQEFFRMAIAEALNPEYGAFTVDERTRMAWFLPGSMEAEWKYELIGLLVSLAVYNGLTLPVTFPKALYRKLLGEPVTELHHIDDGWPELASGLTSLLEWDEKDGLVEDVFARTYEFSVSALGQHITREMKPPHQGGGEGSGEEEEEEWPQFAKTAGHAFVAAAPQDSNTLEDEAPLVTSANRNAYVSDYIRYLTDVSVRPQFEAFARGFRTCLMPKSLNLLNPTLLQSLVEGIQTIDISELKRYVRYIGWDSSHRTVKDFWSIVRKYDDTMKRKLLEFVTASDRIPVGGVKNVMFVLQRNGEEEGEKGRLPTSYTCYGTLLLPEYKDREVLRERLAMALENARGFGFA
ncbi:ubiquitin-protein ligase E3A [Podospora fimiseda]|uniref:HECT-type E3 ubiquitin transferase n=1 Tax=Podospora fimiseda TaxID=252190 RepID=A0AAN7C010_9PEZI|nr:ubiquitin-protein ligase E3A [Podospora fimiseda]